jgi:glutathione-independent formaldehyde dehydrogenase
MKAVVFRGAFEVEVKNVLDPTIEQSTGAVVRITTTNICGSIGVVGVYVPQDPGAKDKFAQEGRIAFDYDSLLQKGLRMGTGQCPVKRYNEVLRDLIVAGRVNPSFIVSHELPLEDAVDAYDKFDKRIDGYTKVLLRPAA